ncbi:MAG TPA: DUF4097 family beta strand repeat-containing protein [Dyella sp.]|uniref:DUF4097 family beta strand repeat-containing protein n=1 Tax=Dyella sp. TaxID=1869338 RepID=UPI002F939E23
MRRLILATLLLVPLTAFAHEECKYQAPRNMKLDLTGVTQVQFDNGSYDLHITGSDSAAGEVTGRACASDQKLLEKLVVTQRREGDRLIVKLGGESFGWTFGSYQASLDISVQLPSKLPIVINVGSGDGWVSNIMRVEGRVGSGDLHLTDIGDTLIASVGSGDIDGRNIGRIELGSVGSGDAKFHDIKGDVKVGSIGSGDATFIGVGGSVRADTLGSGDLTVRNVRGDLTVGAKGSGDVHKSDISGKVNVPHDDDDE